MSNFEIELLRYSGPPLPKKGSESIEETKYSKETVPSSKFSNLSLKKFAGNKYLSQRQNLVPLLRTHLLPTR